MTLMYRVRAASFGWAGGPGLNTFYFGAGDAPGDSSESGATLAHQRVRNAFGGSRIIYPPAWSLIVDSSVDVIDAVTGTLVDNHAGVGLNTEVGAGSAGFNATAIMILVTFRTNQIVDGTRINGRAFLGPLSKGVDADGTPDAGTLTQAQNFGASLLDEGIGGGPPLQVWHRPRPESEEHPVARPGAALDVISYTVKDKYSVLRSRRD